VYSVKLEEINKLKAELLQYNEKRKDLSKKIDPKVMKSFKIKDIDAKINEFFIWVLVFFYKEPAANYYWRNFKREIFKRDEGADFIKRLSAVKAVGLPKEEVFATQKVLEHKNLYLAYKLNAIQKQQLDVLFEVAQVILLSNELGQRISSHQTDANKSKDDVEKKRADSQKIQAKLDAINQRIEIY